MTPRQAFAWLLSLVLLAPAAAEILTPPYFNLALGKRITASATCGDEGPELYCKLVGANADHDEHVIQGQVCDICDANNEAKAHPPDYAVDGLETWWQSPPLSRGMKYNEVNLTIDLGQEFHVAYVFVRMGNSPRPGLWALEKSTDYGKTFKPWQYFSDSPQDCERYFGKESLQPITQDDSVICSTEYSKIVPLEGGEIPISLLNYRPSANKYFNSSVLQEWTRATNVRLRLLRTKNLLAHLMSVARQDPTVTRRYFYSIKDISIGGRCMCNGHADTCAPADPDSQVSSDILVCRCQHHTCGPQCAECCPGYEQKKWRISQNWNRFSCEPCNCHSHSTECVYDPEVDEKRLSLDINGRYEGGGVCKNCQHNTEGINCNKCKPTYYRPYGKQWDEIDVCQPCNCDSHFSTGNCAEETGQCECQPKFNPPYCDSCAYGYFDYPNCKPCTCNLNGTEGGHCTPTDGMCPCKFNYDGQMCEKCADTYYSSECKNCECNSIGSVSRICDKESGNCTCKSKYAGRTCNQCDAGYYNYPGCSHCNCDTSGTEARICDDVTGQCICKEGFGGARCDQCISGYYMEVRGRERVCVPCNCSAKGSTSTSCSSSGKCNCLSNFGGKQCDQCSPGYYKYPECLSCNCDEAGSIGASCDDAGQCHCRKNFDGLQCDHCKEHFYNYPACEECNCDPRGVIASFAGCGSVPAGELCQCKNRVQGRICNDCKPLFWNLQEYNPLGCDECKCDLAGTLGGLGACDTRSGQCKCKLHVDERKCDQCQDGFYNLESTNVFGCTECGCDVGGAVDNNCNKVTGQCRCHSRVEGRRCDRPIQAHYFPTLHQFQYEVEEGLTPSGPVRYRNSDETFPGYSWKGYVVFSILQNEVINIVHISKSSLYRMVLRYVSLLGDPVIATIIITPESVIDTQQKFQVLLKPSSTPTFVTVAGEKGNAPAPLVMDPGNWTVTIKTNKEVLIDYFVLIPEAYYEATILTKLVDKPCIIGRNNLCRHFAYPSLAGRPTASIDTRTSNIYYFIEDAEQLQELNVIHGDIPLLSNAQPELKYNLKIDQPGPYVLLIEYVTPINRTALAISANKDTVSYDPNRRMEISSKGTAIVKFQTANGNPLYALVKLNDCPYTSPCRQVVVDELSKIQIYNIQSTDNEITLQGERDTLAGIKSIVAIPEADWHLDFITPRPYCLRRDGQCAPAVFSKAVDSKKVEIETGVGGDRETRPPILDNSTMVMYLGPDTQDLKIESKVPAPGEYVFVVHYYQPDNPESTVDVMLSDGNQKFNTTLLVEYCPSNSGCRALLRQADDNHRFPLTENFTLTFKGARKGVWLDYVLVMETGDYVNSVLKEANLLDYTREFINKCGNNNYYINTNETDFCRDAVFSITAEYNSGTLQCYCAYEGSTDLECEKFGGQCKCKPNVIGRTCSSCRTGYYGYPDCKPCHCPSTAICDEYGSCICPDNVEGENCDRCKPLTFNFDVQRGCDDCNCNLLGVVDGRLQCDLDDGKCQCKHNVKGRTCDQCVPGHYGFPYCSPCHCMLAGTTDDVCDQNSAQCYCKKHVRGQACDTCKEEYYNLQESNPEGCTKCYCFGKTTRCTKSNYVWAQIIGMDNWYLVNMEMNKTLNVFPHSLSPSMLNDSVIGADLLTDEAHRKVVYFGTPNHYLGKRLTSYGGYLRYSIFYTTGTFGNAIAAADVILGGANGFIVHNSVEQPPALQHWQHSVRIIEEEFTNIDGSAVTRDQFMNTLVNLTAIYIRATYWEEAVTTRLQAVSLDIGMEEDSWVPESARASSIEQCQCPSAYRGLSCEQCAEGHYRLSSGPHAGFCVPCQCNGHSDTCDVHTGICLDCGDNTMGDHCEMCIPGYHGDATTGTPYDCLICACPLPISSNNFAHGCEVSNNGSLISCDCMTGYGGARCGYCAAGFYGNPEKVGEHCHPCNCSGNINVNDPGSCDSITGDCLKCVNNTAGAACNLCAPGFYGDAVFSKNCTACICDEFGMERCDPTTGICVCRSGVLGSHCDHCAPDHWGLATGRGCTPCDCALASEASQCDLETGQCKCAKGVTGRHCEVCAAGYWNYSKDGCDHCNCNTGYSVGFMCNTQTGQCECLPGVIGEKCDRCPDRWVLLPNEGCLACDSCTDALLFTVEDLSYWLKNETQDFKDKADSFFTTQRLNYVWSQTRDLRPRVAALRGVELHNVTNAVGALEASARNALRSAEFAATDSEEQINRAAGLTSKADDVWADVHKGSVRAHVVVNHVSDLAAGLELSQQPKVDSALAEANQIRSEISNKSSQINRVPAQLVFSNATQQIDRMHIFVQPVVEQNKEFEVLLNSTRDLKNQLDEVLQYTDLAQHKADAADRLNANNRASKFGDKVLSVNKQNAAAMEDLIDAAHMIANASNLLTQSHGVSNRAVQALENITMAKQDMEYRIQQYDKDLPDLHELTDQAIDHTNILANRADSLKRIAERVSSNSRTQDAYAAASAYSSIVQEIAAAKNNSDAADAALNDAAILNENLSTRVGPAYERSASLRDRAVNSSDSVEKELRPGLERAELRLTSAKQIHSAADEAVSAINIYLPSPRAFALDEQMDGADKVNATVRDTLDIMSGLGKELTMSKQWAESLPKTADEAQKMISNMHNLVGNIKKSVANLSMAYGMVEASQHELDRNKKISNEKLKKLRNLIEQARTVANRIGVGVSFDKSTTLQPRLPDTIDEMSTSTHVSAYFRTKEKNGLLLYLGNPKDTMLRRTKSDDFMVLEIQQGYPHLVIDIGDGGESGRGPVRISHKKYVADNRWYQVIVDRVGRNIKFTIRESLDDGTEVVLAKDATLPGQHTIFNLDKNKSKLYVGGAPADARLQEISYLAFEGQIEELMIGDSPVGLWNFVSGENLKGARQRDKLTTADSGPTEYRFNGRGYVTIPARKYLQTDKNHVLLFFRTYAPNGLIYLVGEKNFFFSIQMQDGRVYLQFCLGDPTDLVIIGTSKTYNDGKWHKLDAVRWQKGGSLKLDNEPALKQEATGSQVHLQAIDYMNFGGNNRGIVQITPVGFDGCMRQVNLDGVNIDLSENSESVGVTNGCQFASLVSLSGNDSFLRYENVTSENFQITLKFKTSAPDGLLFVFFNRVQEMKTDSISLALVKGKLVLMSQKEELDTGLATYNDSQWHVVTATHSNALRLVVDDFDYFSTDTAPPPLHILDGVLFVGGVQPNYILSGKVGTRVSFAGCLADATLNGRLLNLLTPYNNRSITFGRCGGTTTTGTLPPGQTTWPAVDQPGILPTSLIPTFTQPPEVTTERVHLRHEIIPDAGENTTPATTHWPAAEVPVVVTPAPTTTIRPATTVATTTKRPAPVPVEGCALGYDQYYTVGDPAEGYRFGTMLNSRIEYERLPGRQHDGFDLSLGFRTFDGDGGLIFYASDNRDHQQFLALYMKDGKLHAAFNCGGVTAYLISEAKYNDAQWHSVTLSRNGIHGKLSADNELVDEKDAQCVAPVALVPPFSYGGIGNVTVNVLYNLQEFYKPFKGCLRKLAMNGQPVTEVRQRVNALQCRDNVEEGVYFAPGGGHLRLMENYKVGFDITISLEVKPRNTTGLLLSVHGRRDFLVLELIDNEVLVNVENGKGPFHAIFKLNDKYSLCDGHWHKIYVVKSRHVVSVGVDGHFSEAGLGMSASTDTRSALFIGGHDRPLGKLRGVKSKRGYSGCIRNIIIKQNPVPVPLGAAHGNVHVGICPTD